MTSAASPATTSVCGKVARPSPSDQCSTTIGCSTTTPAGTFMTAPPARKASCSTVNASGDASEHCAERGRRARLVARGEVAHLHALRDERRSSEWCTTRPLRTTTSPARSPASAATGPAAGRGVDARLTEQLGGNRAVPVEIEFVDAAVAPDLLVRASATRGRRGARPPRARRADEPVGAGKCACCVDGEVDVSATSRPRPPC